MSFTTGFAVVPRKMDSGWGVLLTTHSEQLMDADAAQSSMNMLLKPQLSCVIFLFQGLIDTSLKRTHRTSLTIVEEGTSAHL